MKVQTEQFKELVAKATQGASNDKLIPITQLIGIKKSGSYIMLTTTDATNYLYVYGDANAIEKDMYVTVYVEQFAKLISRITSKEIEFNIKNDTLEIIGNGEYTLELPLDENGELIKYPDPYHEKYADATPSFSGKIAMSEVKTIIDSVRPSLANTDELPIIKNYYVGDDVVATNRYKIASFDNKMCDQNLIISSQLMDLLSNMTSDIQYSIAKDHMVFSSDNMKVYSKGIEDVEEYPIDAIRNLIEQPFKSVCKVNKNDFIALLERIALFVGKYDDKAIRLYFEKNGIRVSNKNRKSNEILDYIDSKNYKAYDCIIDIDLLLTQLKAYASDAVELHYNNEGAIKLVDGAITQIVALMTE